MKKWIALLLVIAVAAGAAALLKKRKAEFAVTSPPRLMPAVVAASTLTSGPVTLTLPAMGMVASDASAVLSTKISGQVTHLYRQEGDAVKAGDVLARIDVKDLIARKQGLLLKRRGIPYQIDTTRAEIQALETSLNSARDTHARTLELLAVKGASIEQSSQEEAQIAGIEAKITAAGNSIETLRMSMETLDASMREIDSLMNYATIISPVDGVIGEILARPGDLATPGTPLLRIASRTGLYLNLSLPDNVLTTEIQVNGTILPLTSKHQAGSTGLVQYVAPLPSGRNLVQGQYLKVNVIVYRGDAVLVPVDALLTMNGSSSVFVLEGTGKAQRLPVHIVARGVEGVTVAENLVGRTVITAKPDILLRVSSGVPVKRETPGRESSDHV